MKLSRRSFLWRTSASAVVWASTPLRAASPSRPPVILLRSSWQTVNIGDVAHTPGMLALLEKYLPEASVRLWPSNVGNGVAELLLKRFPKLTIIKGAEEQKRAFAECDFFLHGSGPSLVAAADLGRWASETGKPYGVYGITLGSPQPKAIELLSGAQFAFFRDSVSLGVAKANGVKACQLGLAPDAAFATDLRNDAAAIAFLEKNGLEPGRFLCCIGRLRYTPYWKIRGTAMTAEDRRKDEVNQAHQEADHLPLREAITAAVRATGTKVLVCPEDESQMEVGRRWIVDPLPAEIRKSVVWRERFWLPDEALSIYVRSAGLFGNEMHSPIMCIGNGIPAIVCRWEQQTSKGFMWRDIGLGDWLFDMDLESDRKRVPGVVLAMASDGRASQAKVAAAQQIVHRRQEETMKALAASLKPA
jgi:hypothetical protein